METHNDQSGPIRPSTSSDIATEEEKVEHETEAQVEQRAPGVEAAHESDTENAENHRAPAEEEAVAAISWFDRFLSLWVLLCMGVGWVLGYFLPGVAEALSNAEVEYINIPIAVLIWVMVYPMMIKIDFSTLIEVPKKPKGLIVTSVVNYAIQPFTMYGLALLFFRVIYQDVIPSDRANLYIAGAVILGAGPCTAMVFVWSALVNGDPNYTLIQVALNDVILLVAFAPTVMALLAGSDIDVPFATILLSVVFYIVIPLILALVSRCIISRYFGAEWIKKELLPRLDIVTKIALLLVLVLLFMFQATKIVEEPVDVLLIIVPLALQNYGIFVVPFGICYLWGIPFRIAAPAALISSSNFFELAVAVTVSLYGLDSPATLVPVVGVLVEVPVMLSLVAISNCFKDTFDARTVIDDIVDDEEAIQTTTIVAHSNGTPSPSPPLVLVDNRDPFFGESQMTDDDQQLQSTNNNTPSARSVVENNRTN